MSSWPLVTLEPSSITQLIVEAKPFEPAFTLQTTSTLLADSSVPFSDTVTSRFSRFTLWVSTSGRSSAGLK